MNLAICRGVTRTAVRTLVGFLLAGAAWAAQGADPPDPRLVANYGRLPLAFEANLGQFEGSVRFAARGAGYQLLLTDDATLIQLRRGKSATESTTSAVVMRFAGARSAGSLAGEHELASKSNYFIGSDPALHVVNVPNFATVRRQGIYRGIDAVFYGNARQLEYDLVVAPGADPRAIRLSFEGAARPRLDKSGNLLLRTAAGDLIQYKPAIHQDLGGERRSVAGGYVVRGNLVSIKVAAYDKSRPLVIDPVISYGTYLGGLSTDQGFAIAVDSAGNAYVTGQTQSTRFPGLNGADTRLGHNDADAFVVKLNSTGTAVVYSTYIGGSKGNESGTGIVVDAAANAYVTGTTTGPGFPTTSGAYETTLHTGVTFFSFVTKLNATGSALVYSTYINGTIARGIAIDSAGNAYVTGLGTTGFVATAGAFQATNHNVGAAVPGNAFVAKLNSGGTALAYGTYLGGSSRDEAEGIAVDGSGNAYITGFAQSNDFPVLHSIQSKGATETAFVTKLAASGSALVYSTFLGGSGGDQGNAITVNAQGEAHVTGFTSSLNFPVVNAFQPTLGNNNSIPNAFVAKLNAAGNALVYSSYLGGAGCTFVNPACVPNDGDQGLGVAVDGAGNAYYTGFATSASFPVLYPLGADLRLGTRNAYVTKVGPDGYRFYTVLVGGSGQSSLSESGDVGEAVAVDANGGVYLTGSTDSQNFPVTSGAFQTSIMFDARKTPVPPQDAFVAKLSSPVFNVALSTNGNNVVSGQIVTLTATVAQSGSSTPPTGTVTFREGGATLGTPALANGIASLGLSSLAVGIHRFTAVYNNNGDGGSSPPLYQAVNQSVCTGGSPPQPVPGNAPLVVLTAPANCSLIPFGSAIALTASAADANGGVQRVDFLANALPVGSAPTPPYTVSWTPSAGGNYAITAVATNVANTTTTSLPLNVVIGAAPTVHMTGPSSGTFRIGTSVTASANATASAGATISLVRFLANGSQFGTTNVLPYSALFSPPTPGLYTLSATATDTNGSTAASDNTIDVTFAANAPPQVAIQNPIANTQFITPATFTIQATAFDPDGVVTKVDFQLDGSPLKTVTAPPYTANASVSALGPHSVTATATDNDGATGSAIVSFSVIADPTETITYLHNDFAGNPIAATDVNGQLVWKETFKPYGDRINNQQAASGNRQWFGGKAQDQETGLSYFGARYYDPVVGRFMGVDAVGFRDRNLNSFNRYAYGSNNPLRYFDPDGLEGVEVRSSNLLRAIVPGQVAWDTARSSWANGEYGSAAVWATVMVGEQLLAVGTLGTTQIAGAGARAAGTTVASGEATSLFRAVRQSELADVQATNAFRNPNGIESKYFSTSAEGAASFAKQASRAFGDGPYTIVETKISSAVIKDEMRVTVDRGISSVALPTESLSRLSSPRVWETMPIPSP